MSRQQQTEEREQWENRLLDKLESGAREACALRQLLEAEARAALPVQLEQELKHERH